MTPRAAIAEIEKIVSSAAVKAVNRTLTDLKAEAVKMSSGIFKTAQLRRMDHPFATRHSTPLLDPAIINVQTGEFRASWGVSRARVTDPGSTGVLASGRLFNDDVKADILDEGTLVMVPRPIRAALEAKAMPLLEKHMKDALRESESRHGR